ncbi:MAG: ABC transporter permease [Eubacteriales bacterium]|nr:ABC transporter permease [Eubacteriales bacterium]
MKQAKRISALLRRHGVLLALLALAAAAAFAFPQFLTYGNLTNILRQSSMIGLISLGMTFVLLTGGIDLSVGSLAALASVLAATFSSRGSTALMIFAPVLACGALGLCNGLIISKMKIAPFITTLGMMMAARGAALVMTDGVSVRVDADAADAFGLLARSYILKIPTPVWVFFLVLAAGVYVTKKTRPGRHVYAVGGNEEAARMMGLRPDRVKIAVYTANGLLAGLAGVILASRLSAGQPVSCDGWEMNAIAAAAIGGTQLSGGRGGLGGTVTGVLIIGVISNMINLQGTLNSWWQSIITGLLLLLVVMMQSRMQRRPRAHIKAARG